MFFSLDIAIHHGHVVDDLSMGFSGGPCLDLALYKKKTHEKRFIELYQTQLYLRDCNLGPCLSNQV